jgi:hypothetical protein
MRAQIFRSHRLAAAGVIAVALAVGALSQRAGAFNPQPDPPGYGMIGIADGQTARLNVVNLGVPDPTTGFPPDPCRMRLQFVNADGNVLVSRGIAPEMGHSAFLDFAPSFVPVNTTDAVAAAPLRAEIRAVLFSDNLSPPDPCRVTLEIFDNATGRTQIALIPPDPCRGARCRAAQR